MGQKDNRLRETKLSQTLQKLQNWRIKASICKRQDPELKFKQKENEAQIHFPFILGCET